MSGKSQALAADTYPAHLCRIQGFATVKQVAEFVALPPSEVISLLLCRTEAVFLQDGSYSKAAQQFATSFRLPEDMLFGVHPEAEALRKQAEVGFVEQSMAEPTTAEDKVIQDETMRQTVGVLASLTPREDRVLRMRFGIGMGTDHVLEEVGQEFSVTRERIREVEAKALRTLKHPGRQRKLRNFLDK